MWRFFAHNHLLPHTRGLCRSETGQHQRAVEVLDRHWKQTDTKPIFHHRWPLLDWLLDTSLAPEVKILRSQPAATTYSKTLQVKHWTTPKSCPGCPGLGKANWHQTNLSSHRFLFIKQNKGVTSVTLNRTAEAVEKISTEVTESFYHTASTPVAFDCTVHPQSLNTGQCSSICYMLMRLIFCCPPHSETCYWHQTNLSPQAEASGLATGHKFSTKRCEDSSLTTTSSLILEDSAGQTLDNTKELSRFSTVKESKLTPNQSFTTGGRFWIDYLTQV